MSDEIEFRFVGDFPLVANLEPGEVVLYDKDGKVYARRKDGERWRVEPDGVNIIEIDTCQVNDIGQAFGQSIDGVFHGFTKAPPGTYRVLLERIGD